MKAKILLTVIATMTISYLSLAADTSDLKGSANLSSGQQVVVSSYHFDNGYEYASRIRRFHNSYTAFDFYSPVYTEVYWYTYTPNTWGVSIYDYGYDNGYYLSPGWGSACSGSYWWGYSPYAMYDPWWDYGFGSNSRISITVNIGRPHNHYPSAMSYYGWHNSYNRPVYVVNNYYDYSYNNYYQTDYTRREARVRPHDDRQVSNGGRTNTGSYTIVNGRSGSEANRIDEVSGNRRSANTNNADVSNSNNNGNNSNNSNNGVRNGNPDNARGHNDRDQGNNGLRVGQYRRGNATDSEGRSNNPRRVNNPNVNDRNNPGREKEDVGYRSGNRAATTTTANTNTSNTTVVSNNTGQSGTGTVNSVSNSSQNNANVQEKPGRRQTRSASQSKDESRSSNASGSGSAKQKDDSRPSRRSSSGTGGK